MVVYILCYVDLRSCKYGWEMHFLLMDNYWLNLEPLEQQKQDLVEKTLIKHAEWLLQ